MKNLMLIFGITFFSFLTAIANSKAFNNTVIHSMNRVDKSVLSKKKATRLNIKEEKSSTMNGVSVGFIINQAKEAINEIIEKAFDRFDLTVLKAAMEADALIDGAALNLKDVISHSIDELDGQQRRIIGDLQNIHRLVATDIEKALLEIREEKNMAISDLRLLLSNYPGAVRVIPSFAMEGSSYIDFQLLGTALSKAKFKNTKFNGRAKKFDIVNQSDTRVTIRVPLSHSMISDLLRKNRGKPTEVRINFDFVEYSWWDWWDWWETDRRQFAATGYVMPKFIGTAQAVFSGELVEKEKKTLSVPFYTKQIESSIGWSKSGGKRGSVDEIFSVSPGRGWTIDEHSAKFKFERLKKGCSKGFSSATWVKRNDEGLSVKVIATTHKGNAWTKHYCTTKTTITYTKWRNKSARVEHFSTSAVRVMANSDVKFKIPSAAKKLDNIRLNYVRVTSPLFENGTRKLRPGEQIGGLKLHYSPGTQTAFLRFENF